MTSRNIIVVKNLAKRFPTADKENLILSDVSFRVRAGEIVALVGKTGCGKTTLLRMISGFEKVTSGQIFVNGKLKNSPSKDCIMVSQYINQLLPWRTALANVYKPLLETGIVKNKPDAVSIAKKILSEVELTKQENMYPEKLSGGQKQRVAIARALALSPAVLFLDEPFVALDENTREKLCVLTHQLCKKRQTTVLMVTHSVEEAIRMADRVFVMSGVPATLTKEFLITSYKCPNKKLEREIRARII